jgi:hypothetical protein
VAAASPLALTSVSTPVVPVSTNIFLYYKNLEGFLTRVAGTVTGSSINWHQSNVVEKAPRLLSSTLMAATTTGASNYVYYIPDGKAEFEQFAELIQPFW